MNALDIAARALAGRTSADLDERDEGGIGLHARSEPTAKALEELAVAYGLLTGRAGEIHTVETTPYPTRNGLVIRGNGAELRNINPTDLGADHLPVAALSLGDSTVWSTPYLTYYAIQSANGPELAVAPGEGENFAPGDLVIVHGSTHYSGWNYPVFRNVVRARVVSASADTITIDRALPGALLADMPVIGNVEEGIEPAFEGPDRFYLIHRPHISNLVLSSDEGETWKWGGVIDGTFRDVTSLGRNGVVFNAMQDCLFENIHFQAWRKICELAESSLGTTVRTLRGSLMDASQKYGGESDVPGTFISMNENCAECVYEDFNVSSGPNSAVNGCQMRAGRNNVVRNSILSFPAHTGNGLLLVSHAEAGNPNQDCGFENLQVFLPVCSTFFRADDLGAGVIRPFFRNIKFFGSVSNRAGQITGDQGVLENVWCEDGGLLFAGPCTNWRIENCYFPDGFENLTREVLHTNNLHNNESDASRRIAAAAVVEAGHDVVTATAANQTYRTLTIAPGDLGAMDEVHFRLAGITSGGGTNTRHVRVTASFDGSTEVEIAHLAESQNLASWALEGTIVVQANSTIHSTVNQMTSAGTIPVDSRTTNGDLNAFGLVVKVEVWTEVDGRTVVRLCKIAGQKPGMRNVAVFN